MNKIFFTLFILTFLVKMAFAQNGFYIQNGGSVIVKNNAIITLNNTKLVNNATFSASNGTLNIVGNATNENSAIEGSGTTTLEHLTIDKSSNSVQLNQNIAITGNLTLSAGGLELNNGSVDFGTTGSLQSETATNRVFGTGGQLMATVDLNVPTNSNPANLGAEISSTQNLGVTLIKRGHTEFSNTSNSILRYFDISPTSNTSLNATLRYHYFETELNGNVENSLNLWRSTDAGVTWTEQTNTTRDITNNQAEVTGIAAFSRWTAAVTGALSDPCVTPTAFNVTGGGTFCKGLAGVVLSLSDSEIDVNYQLLLNNVATGSPVAGTGDVISFGNQTENGTYTVVATSVGACTATMTGNQTVTADETLPAFSLATVPANVTVDCNNIPTAATVTATNICSTITMTSISTQGTDNTNCNFYNYTITRTWTATDKRNNTTSISQIITVKNNGTASIGPFTTVAVSESGIPQTLTVAATSCMPAPIISYTDVRVNNSLSNCYTYNYTLNRIWSVTDICGNTNSATQTIIVKGITITCPSDKTIYTNSDGTGNYNCSTLATASMGLSPNFTDICDISALRYAITGVTTGSGSGTVAGVVFQKGVSAATYTLQHSGQTDYCRFNLTVKDNEAPKMSFTPTIVLDACDFPSPISNIYNPVTSDNCSGTVNITILTDVLANVTTCASKTATQKYTKLLVRTWKATDENGNFSTSTQKFYLRDMQAPTASCKIPTVSIGSSPTTAYAAANLNNSSSDNCTLANSLTYKACIGASCTNFASNLSIAKTLIPTGQNQATVQARLQVRDACGNVSICNTTLNLTKATALKSNNNNNNNNNNGNSNEEEITVISKTNIPTSHGEIRCFPNPFAEDLTIQYNLLKNVEKVALKIYDSQGRFITAMEEQQQVAGFYSVRWNLSDLQAGMYQVCLEINGEQKNIERVIMMQ